MIDDVGVNDAAPQALPAVPDRRRRTDHRARPVRPVVGSVHLPDEMGSIFVEGPVSEADLAAANSRLAGFVVDDPTDEVAFVRRYLPTPPPLAVGDEDAAFGGGTTAVHPASRAPGGVELATYSYFRSPLVTDLAGDREGPLRNWARTDWPELAAYLWTAIECWPHHRVFFASETTEYLRDAVEVLTSGAATWESPAVHAGLQADGAPGCGHDDLSYVFGGSRSDLRLPDAYRRLLLSMQCECGLRSCLPGDEDTVTALRGLDAEDRRLVSALVNGGRATWAKAIEAAVSV